jgi:hypothetical protein
MKLNKNALDLKEFTENHIEDVKNCLNVFIKKIRRVSRRTRL